MASGPSANFTPGCHSRKISGVFGATTTGSAVLAPRRRKAAARWRGSYSFLYGQQNARIPCTRSGNVRSRRSEEHTSELQSLTNLVCRLLLEKKKRSISQHAA